MAGASAQQAPQTIDLPSIDRTQIAFRLDAEPSVVIGPGRVPGGYYGTPNRVARLSDGRLMMATAWGFSQLHVVDPGGKALSIGDLAASGRRSATGRLVRVLRVGSPLDPVTPELRSAFIEEEFAGNTAAYRERTIGYQRLGDAATHPSHLPAYSDIRVDRSGQLWVRRYPRPLEKTQEWWVFTAEARYLGRVEMPAALGVEEIGDDYVVGSYLVRKAARPESDAIMDQSEYDVRLYRLRRN